MRFLADEISPAFVDEHLSVLSAPKGILFPFVLSFPDKKPLQTSNQVKVFRDEIR